MYNPKNPEKLYIKYVIIFTIKCWGVYFRFSCMEYSSIVDIPSFIYLSPSDISNNVSFWKDKGAIPKINKNNIITKIIYVKIFFFFVGFLHNNITSLYHKIWSMSRNV